MELLKRVSETKNLVIFESNLKLLLEYKWHQLKTLVSLLNWTYMIHLLSFMFFVMYNLENYMYIIFITLFSA